MEFVDTPDITRVERKDYNYYTQKRGKKKQLELSLKI